MKRMMLALIAGVLIMSAGTEVSAAGAKDAHANRHATHSVSENRDNGKALEGKKYQVTFKDAKDDFGDHDSKKNDKDHGKKDDKKEDKKGGNKHGNKNDNKNDNKHDNKYDNNKPGMNKPSRDDESDTPQVTTETTMLEDGSWYVSEYDAAGYLTKRTFYFADGTMNYYFISEYNEAGLETSMKIYNPEGEMISYSVNEYNADGARIKAIFYNTDGSMDVNEYDRVNNTHTYSFYDVDGNMVSKETYQLDAEGNYIGLTVYNLDGTIAQVYVCATDAYGNISLIPIEGNVDWSRIKATMMEDDSVYVFVYDENGLETECSYYDANLELVHKTTNKYNDAFECVESIVYEADGRYCVNTYDRVNRTHTCTAYTADGTMYDKGVYDLDENGNYIRYTEYNMDGTVKQVYNYTTDENGNGILTPVE